MIISPNWIWIHVPKCGGTSATRILEQIYGSDPSVHFDQVDNTKEPIWHHTLPTRQAYDPELVVGERRVIACIRRLPHWVLSRVHFEVQRSGDIALVTREQLIQGCYRERPAADGKQRPLARADNMISRFSKGVTDWIRTESLSDDMMRIFELSPDHLPTTKMRANKGRIDYVRDLSFWFSPTDLEKMYASNPVWADIEKQVYGSILAL